MADSAVADLELADDTGFESRFVTAPDGLRLHVRRYGAAGRTPPADRLPARPDAQRVGFPRARERARRMMPSQPRLVVTIDSRGRGRSDYDRDPDNYSFPVELADVLAVLSALEIGAGDLSRHVARRHPGDAARRGAAGRDRRRDPQRHRAGDRRQGAGAAQGLCRQAADPAQPRRGRRDPAPARGCAVSRAYAEQAWLRQARQHLEAGQRRACARL